MKVFLAIVSAVLTDRVTINQVYPNDPRDDLGIEDYQPDQDMEI